MSWGSFSTLDIEGKNGLGSQIGTYLSSILIEAPIEEPKPLPTKKVETETEREKRTPESNTKTRILGNLERFREKPIQELTQEEIHAYIELLAASGVETNG